jgi:hypothetical protein
MIELLRTNDTVLLSYIDALLAGEGIDCVILDQHTSVLEGSIGAIPRRVMVAEADAPRARLHLADAGLGHVLGPV